MHSLRYLMPTKQRERGSVPRAARTLLDVLPRSVDAEVRDAGNAAVLVLAGQRLRLGWAGDGGLRSVRQLLDEDREEFDIVAARRLSPAARALLADAGLGWADESGAAEIAVGGVVVSREGRSQEPDRLTRWTPSVTAVAEALLCGTDATVAATEEATGLSTGSCTNALRFLSDEGLLTADAKRGRGSARRLEDPDRLLDAYVAAVDAAKPAPSLQVGLQGRDLLEALGEVGAAWDSRGVGWAATGVAAAAVIAPLLTSVSSVEVYVEANTPAGLDARASDAGLRPIAGGRLTLRPFPTATTSRLAERHDGLRVAPWTRVYADLRRSGVRGEEAAEHLREIVRG
jgi:hypothetical protein